MVDMWLENVNIYEEKIEEDVFIHRPLNGIGKG